MSNLRIFNPSATAIYMKNCLFNTYKQPVANVSLEDGFAKGLSEKTVLTCRLPAEVESEYAASAGKMTSRFLGNNPDYACKHSKVANISVKRHFKMDGASLW